MISLFSVLYILGIHWCADFICQTHWQATNKSKNIIALIKHTVTYSTGWLLLWPLIHNNVVPFILITFIAHTITDFFTSKWTAKLYKKQDWHNFFIVIGFDQLLHFTQLLVTFYLLS